MEIPPLEESKESGLKGGFSMLSSMNVSMGGSNKNCDCNCGGCEETPESNSNCDCGCSKDFNRNCNCNCDCVTPTPAPVGPTSQSTGNSCGTSSIGFSFNSIIL